MERVLSKLLGVVLLSLALGASVNAGISDLRGGTDPAGWWVAFRADDEGGYTGPVFHAHIYDPGEADDMLRYGLGVASVIFGLIPGGQVPALVAGITALAAESAVNGDGSYDYYIFVGRKRGWGGVWVSFCFSGFVSDQWWKPPVGLEIPGCSLPVMNTVWAREMGNFFRNSPTPPTKPQVWTQWLGVVPGQAPLRVEGAVSVHNSGDYISFRTPFPQVPVVITSAQEHIWIHDANGNPVSGAWLQWIALVPNSSLYVFGGIRKASDGQRIDFPTTLPRTPVIVTNAQKGRALRSCAVDNSRWGFWIAIRDHNNNPVSDAWLIWLAVIPDTRNGFKGEVRLYSDEANVSFSPPFPSQPVYVLSAQKNREPYIAGAVNNRRDGFLLSLVK